MSKLWSNVNFIFIIYHRVYADDVLPKVNSYYYSCWNFLLKQLLQAAKEESPKMIQHSNTRAKLVWNEVVKTYPAILNVTKSCVGCRRCNPIVCSLVAGPAVSMMLILNFIWIGRVSGGNVDTLQISSSSFGRDGKRTVKTMVQVTMRRFVKIAPMHVT